MHDQQTSQSTGSPRSQTGGSAGTPGRAGRDQDENARVADTSPGDIRTGSQATVGRQGGPRTGATAYERGTAGFEETRGMTERSGVRGRMGPDEGNDWGMQQMSRMLREAHEEGDPELVQRVEDLHARQQNLGERERSLREREEALRGRERNLRERESKYTGNTGGLGAQDYTDDIHIQNRR